eukprot:CAMPEP_0206207952 /NCGR_PEP_ID=MMETSP0166-20121206/15913_1 /ASSEMBLY_ACC=CAM_ASM_000260 /TAXON_ID=95228 /ORGANISM="Vannella robusta, Strain DIVA3 518/3/11/1/6" /LENGTH=552 /DNA_ID=CAMNT_0053628843 /DNA_START=86 /DNA_END=1743 /DNA_ORIENTATION=+
MTKDWAVRNSDAHVHWPKLFYNYCKGCGRSISRKEMEELHSSMQYAVNTFKKKDLVELCSKILEYAGDGGNTLVGLQPNESFFSQYYGKKSSGLYQILTPASATDVGRGRAETKIIRSSKRKAEKTKLFAAGDLAIYFQHGAMTPSNGIFVRVLDAVEEDQKIARIYPAPMEIVDKGIRTEHLLVLHPDIVDEINEGPTKKLIQDPIEAWEKNISHTILAKTMDFLSCQGILREDLQYVEALAMAPSLGMNQIITMPLCQKAIDIFTQLMGNDSTNTLSQEIQYLGGKELETFISNEELIAKAFQPTRKTQIEEISNFDFTSVVQTGLEKYCTSCKHVLYLLEKEKQKLLDGSCKQELSDWWLEKIADEFADYVTSHGVDLKAINSNYIDEEPEDIEVIHANLMAIEKIFADFHGITADTELSKWIRQLMSSIYKRVIQSIALFVIAMELNLSTEGQTLETINSAIKKNGLKPSESVQNLIMDVSYVEKMKAMEEHFKTSEKPMKGFSVSNVVPISGLIMGSFYRLENELRTILELYSGKASPHSTERCSTP